MTIAFADDFNRNDGPLGPGWIVDLGTGAVHNNQGIVTISGICRPEIQPLSADACQRAFVSLPESFPKSLTLRFRATLNQLYYKQVYFIIYADRVVVTIYYRDGGAQQAIADHTLYIDYGTHVDLMAAVAGDQILAWVEGTLVLAVTMPNVPDAGYVQIIWPSYPTYIDEYYLYDLATNPLSVTVEEDVGGAPDYILHLVNGGAPWTPGVPGLPIFTAPSGTITSQEVIDEDHADVYYTAPTITMPLLIHDYQNDWYYPLNLSTSLLGLGGGGGGGGLTEEQAATLTALATYLAEYDTYTAQGLTLMLRTNTQMLLMNAGTFGETHTNLDNLLVAILAETGDLQSIHVHAHDISNYLSDLTEQGTVSLLDVVSLIQGAGAHTIADVLTAIAALTNPATDLTTIINLLWEIRTVAHSFTLGSVMDAIAAIDVADIAEVLEQLDQIRTIGSWTFGSVKDWIEAIPYTDYTPTLTDIHDHVVAIPTNPITSLQSVLDAIAAVRGAGNPDLAAILAAVAAIPTNPITSLQTVLDAIAILSTLVTDKTQLILDAIAALTPATPSYTAPVWPGLGNVTLGAPVALAVGVTMSGQMDGVVIELTYVPPETGRYLFDAEQSWVHLGALAFLNDDGAAEGFQPFSFGKHILTPLRLTHAYGAYVRCALGVQGTITPWTINEA